MYINVLVLFFSHLMSQFMNYVFLWNILKDESLSVSVMDLKTSKLFTIHMHLTEGAVLFVWFHEMYLN